MQSITHLALDVQSPSAPIVAAAKQNDTLGRAIVASLFDGAAAFYPDSALAVIRYRKPDGTAGFYDTLEDDETPAYTIDGNVITFTLAEQMLTVAGDVLVDVNFYSTDGEKLTAFAFILRVQASVLDDATIISSDYYNVLTATLAEAAELAANLPVPSDLTPVADSASGSAGTGNGFARGDHSHPINVATSGTPSPDGTGALGTAATYARTDHVHPLNVASSGTPSADGTAARGTSGYYARFDHVHPLNVATSGTPADLGTAARGSASSYARSDHVHNIPAAWKVEEVTVTLSANANVSPFSTYGTASITGATGYTAVMATVTSSTSTNPVAIRLANNSTVAAYGKAAGDITVTVLLLRNDMKA